jgi:hypothetical protein
MKIRSLVSTVGAVVVVAAVSSASVARADTNQITGKIADAKNHPLAGMCAVAFGKPGPIVQSAPTLGDGVYTITGLGVTSWEVLAVDCTNHPAIYSPVDHPNIHGLDDQVAKFIKFTQDGKVHKGVNFKMPLAGHIAVTLLDCASMVPVTGIDVCPIWAKLDHKKNIFQSGFCGFTSGPSADPSMDGQILLDVTAGDNKVEALTGGIIWSGNEPDFDSAAVVTVAPGATVPVVILANSPCTPS